MLIQRFRVAREKLGISQRELAQRCNFSPNQIARYENGLSEPIAESLRTVSQQLHVSTDYLLGLTDEPQGFFVPSDITPIEREVLDAFRRDGWLGIARLGIERAQQLAEVSK